MTKRLIPIAVFAAILAGGSSPAVPVRFQAFDSTGRLPASVEIDLPLPDRDSQLVFRGPDAEAGLVRPLTYEAVGDYRCHGSDLIVICETDIASPAVVRLDGGQYARRLNEDTILVANSATGRDGDFATFRNGDLVSFGVMNETGAVGWRYNR